MKKKYIVNEIEFDFENYKHYGVEKRVIEVLLKRDIENIDAFLNPGIKHFYNENLMADMEKGVKIIGNAIKNNEKIVVYGDYDCDGIGGTAVAVLALRNLGANVDYYINNRFNEGYGICESGFQNILKKYPDVKLIVTVDNGITGNETIENIKNQNIKVVVTDHHEPKEDLPKADAVINPKRKDCPYPFKELCGAGVIFKVMLNLYKTMNKDLSYLYSLLDIVAMSTIGDVVPVLEENRIIVAEGLKIIENRYAFQAIKEQQKIDTFNAHYTIPFAVVPVINAIGRIDGNVNEVVELFLETDKEKIVNIVTKLIEFNEIRKQQTEMQHEIAKTLVESDKKICVLYHKSFEEGIVGIIAGRIKDEFSKPTIVLAETEDGILKASGRSFDNFSLKDTLDEISKEYPDLLLGYGGHKKACGFSIEKENFDKIKKILEEKAEKLEDFTEEIEIDLILNSFEINEKLIKDLSLLEPFGEGFKPILLGLKNYFGKSFSYIGKEKEHVKVSNNLLDVIIFNGADRFKELNEPLNIKAIGNARINEFNGKKTIQFIPVDFYKGA